MSGLDWIVNIVFIAVVTFTNCFWLRVIGHLRRVMTAQDETIKQQRKAYDEIAVRDQALWHANADLKLIAFWERQMEAQARFELLSDFIQEIDTLKSSSALTYDQCISAVLAKYEQDAILAGATPPTPSLTDALLCQHANEVPHYCPCDSTCYCRVLGSCKSRT